MKNVKRILGTFFRNSNFEEQQKVRKANKLFLRCCFVVLLSIQFHFEKTNFTDVRLNKLFIFFIKCLLLYFMFFYLFIYLY